VVEFDPTEACNLACPGCISEDLVCNKTSFSRERLLGIANELYEIGTKAVILIGGGEPLAHPAIGEFMQFLGEHDIHIGITTNGSLIGKYNDIIAKYVFWTRVSMDAATAETFNKLRPSKDGENKFDSIISQMRELAKTKKGNLGFSYLIRTEADGFGIESNIHEIYDAAVLARETGCDYFEVKPSYSYVDGQDHALVKHSPERMAEARKEIERLDELVTPTFRITKAINLEDSLNCVDTPQAKDYHTCPVAELRTLVTPSGVYICPYWRGKDPYNIGNAHSASIKEIWNGQRRNDVMKNVDPSVVCPFHCLRNESNKEVLKLIKTDISRITLKKEYDRFI
jgi:MoaA/NifB/PqqE/SkfB family radical SAM enzyme